MMFTIMTLTDTLSHGGLPWPLELAGFHWSSDNPVFPTICWRWQWRWSWSDDEVLTMLAHFLFNQSFPSSTVFKCEDYAKNDHVHRQWPIPPPDSATLPKLTGGGKFVWISFLAFQTWPHTGYTRSSLWTSTISSSTGWWSTYLAPLWPMVRWGLLKKHIHDVRHLSIS